MCSSLDVPMTCPNSAQHRQMQKLLHLKTCPLPPSCGGQQLTDSVSNVGSRMGLCADNLLNVNAECGFVQARSTNRCFAQTLCVNIVDSQNASMNHVNIITLVTRSYFCSLAQTLCSPKSGSAKPQRTTAMLNMGCAWYKGSDFKYSLC